jgi:hypothetical protein
MAHYPNLNANLASLNNEIWRPVHQIAAKRQFHHTAAAGPAALMVRQFIEERIAFANENGYVTTLFGRKRRIPELRARQRHIRRRSPRSARRCRRPPEPPRLS